MSEIQAVVLGLIQGLTEFLPVSSSGHLTIFKTLFGLESGNDLNFEVAVHAATVLSTIVAFRKDILKLLKGFFNLQMNPEKQYIFKIGVSMIPVFVVGMFFKEQVEEIFGSGLTVVGIMLLVTALLLSLSEILTKKAEKGGKPGKPVGYKEAFVMGIAQAIAVLPGLSRSGSTISTGLMLGVKKAEVAGFSFLMVLIPILGEAFIELVGGDFGSSSGSVGILPLTLGFVTAFVSGLFACTLMINLVKRAKLWGFAVYCTLAGIACIVGTVLSGQ